MDPVEVAVTVVLTPNQREPQKLRGSPAATVYRLTMLPRSRPPWIGSASATLYTFMHRKERSRDKNVELKLPWPTAHAGAIPMRKYATGRCT